jgi:hypothetical protein
VDFQMLDMLFEIDNLLRVLLRDFRAVDFEIRDPPAEIGFTINTVLVTLRHEFFEVANLAPDPVHLSL